MLDLPRTQAHSTLFSSSLLPDHAQPGDVSSYTYDWIHGTQKETPVKIWSSSARSGVYKGHQPVARQIAVDYKDNYWPAEGAMNNNYEDYASSATSFSRSAYPRNGATTFPDSRHNSMAFAQNQIAQQGTLHISSATGSRAPSPVLFDQPSRSEQISTSRQNQQHAVAPYLRLPAEIANGRPGSLAEFTAEITCLFWFESAVTLLTIEQSSRSPTPATRLAPDAIPATGFLKWVTTILTTTQVSTSVVLLAVLFIFRLKTQNPQVNGKAGSEYRLLTVALMLGNKFLDDNTYTNKTWAEVSGIDVKEIHVMEVEFLSHMKYNLYTSKDQWRDWYRQLNKFWTYHERASKISYDPYGRGGPRPGMSLSWALPSPPASARESPQYVHSISPSSAIQPTLPPLPLQMTPAGISPVSSLPDFARPTSAGRKRSWDEVALEPAPKRQSVQPLSRNQSTRLPQHHGMPRLDTFSNLPMLPIPNLPGSNSQRPFTSQDVLTPQSLPPPNVLPQPRPYSQSARNTPSSSYLPSANWLQGLPQPSQRSGAAMPYASGMSNPVQSRHQTPTAGFQGLNFEAQHSPSHYLDKRPSPYRPVRNMSQLTQAPPSRDMYEYPAQVAYEQIQWQPLKKNVDEGERRIGTVPYYNNPYGYPSHQSFSNPSVHYEPYIRAQ